MSKPASLVPWPWDVPEWKAARLGFVGCDCYFRLFSLSLSFSMGVGYIRAFSQHTPGTSEKKRLNTTNSLLNVVTTGTCSSV